MITNISYTFLYQYLYFIYTTLSFIQLISIHSQIHLSRLFHSFVYDYQLLYDFDLSELNIIDRVYTPVQSIYNYLLYHVKTEIVKLATNALTRYNRGYEIVTSSSEKNEKIFNEENGE